MKNLRVSEVMSLAWQCACDSQGIVPVSQWVSRVARQTLKKKIMRRYIKCIVQVVYGMNRMILLC